MRAKFTGHERDLAVLTSDADDLDYMHARFYNSQLARFLSVDRLQGSPYRPQSLNRYAYVLGSPINFVDPWGLAATSGDDLVFNGSIDVIGHRNPLDDYFDGIDASRPGGGGGSWSVTRNLGRPGLRLGLALGVTGTFVRDGLFDIVSACFSSSPSASVQQEASCWVLLGAVGGGGPKFADPKFAARLSRQYAKYGVRSVEKSLRSISKNLAEHEARLASGRLSYTSSIEREVRTFRGQIETIEQFLERIGGSL